MITSEQTPKEVEAGLQGLLDAAVRVNPKADTDLIRKAFYFSFEHHKDQKRRSGELYFNHPLEVARILVELQLDSVTIATGLLHDTVEDTVATVEEIKAQFGPEIAAMVDGVTKISKITFQTSEERQAENFRKMILAMAQDIRVILVKLADRTHNMRTLQHLKAEKQARIAQETLEIYSPIANRLGLQQLKRELEDLSLRYSKPEIYYQLVQSVNKRLKEREDYTKEVQTIIQSALREHGYADVVVTGRPKHFYSIHKKMEKRSLTFDQVHDITGFRVIVASVEQCYGILGLIHSLWTPVPGRFKDYIAIPKANFYQSLHTAVIGPGGEKIEIQIRTQQMHDTAERGIAAHWAYKQGIAPVKEPKSLGWLNRLVEWNRSLSDPNEFLETVKLDLFSEDIYIFTPRGEVRELPIGSTPLDFAYTIHTDLGHHCIGAKVNDRMVPLKYKLKSGDTVEILSSPNQNPNKDWLKIVKTSRAKAKIRQFIKQAEHDHSLEMGSQILERECRKEGLAIKTLDKEGTLKKVAAEFGLKTAEDLYSAVGYGKLSAKKVLTKIAPKPEGATEEKAASQGAMERIYEAATKKNRERQVVTVKGIEDLLVRFAKCCNPVPGDSVIGFITRGRGISVHTKKCPKVFDVDSHRLVDIEWDLTKKAERKVKVRVVCPDRAGLLAEMSQLIKENGSNIYSAQISTTKDRKAMCVFNCSILDASQLRKVISALEGIPGVISVERVQKKQTS